MLAAMKQTIFLLSLFAFNLFASGPSVQTQFLNKKQKTMESHGLYVIYNFETDALPAPAKELINRLADMSAHSKFHRNLAPACPILSFGGAGKKSRGSQAAWYDEDQKWIHVSINSANPESTLKTLAGLLNLYCHVKGSTEEEELAQKRRDQGVRYYEYMAKKDYQLTFTNLLAGDDNQERYLPFLKKIYNEVLSRAEIQELLKRKKLEVFVFIRDSKDVSKNRYPGSKEKNQIVTLNLSPDMELSTLLLFFQTELSEN